MMKYPTRGYAARSAFLIPGAFFLAIGLAALFAPKFLLALIAGVFLFVGVLLCIVGWKLFHLKRRVEEMARGFSGKIYVQGIQVEDPFETEFTVDEDDPKITYH